MAEDVENRDRNRDRSRLLFGVQLEVTSLLLEAERRKLSVLQRELQIALEEGGSIKAKEHQKQELIQAITKIQSEYDHLDKEFRQQAMGVLRSSNTRGSGKLCAVILWFPGVGGLPLREEGSRGTPAQRLAMESCSTFRPLPEKPVRGGVQVLPPMVPPRAPVKPKPPVPPKRDELTRLTTVKKDPIPIVRPAPPDHPPPPIPTADEVAKPLEVLERKILERSEHRSLSEEPVESQLRRNSTEKKSDEPKTFSETIEHFERQGSFGKSNGKAGKSLVRSNSETKPVSKNVDYENSVQFECSEVLYASINPETKKQPNAHPSGAVRDNSLSNDSNRPSDLPKLTSPVTKDAPLSMLKRLSEEKEESSEDEGATADIWVRAIESPVKKADQLPIRSNSTSDEKEEKSSQPHRASIDNSQLRTPPKIEKPSIIVENKEPDLPPETTLIDKRLSKLGTESLPCSRPSSRAASRSSSPAAFGHEKEKKKISAAEALGVVAKPCPRPPPGKRKNQLEFRRQSLGNLSDTKLSMGCSTSCPSHQLWSSFGECHEQEYRRHERSRGQSADSRTLQRLKSDNWETQSYSSTLSRIGKYSTAKYFNKEEQPQQCRHPPDVGKRTFSVEELPTGTFVRGSNTTGSARNSLGKSPRVTFALSEEEMGASGGATPKYHTTVRARSYDADDKYHQQSNRSQPAIGLKQTPKARMDDADIQAAVESILGKGAKVVDCEKKSTIREEEVLLVNGRPVRLEVGEGPAIRDALSRGAAPGPDLLNQILVRAGILAAPVRLETSLSVRSSVLSREQMTVSRGGAVVDGRSRETAEEHSYSSTTAELWEPASTANTSASNLSSFTNLTKDSSSSFSRDLSTTDCPSTNLLSTSSLLTSLTKPFSSTSSTASTTTSEDSAGSDLGISDLSLNSSSSPTIFGTVASDQTPKDTGCRRTLPQTTPPGVANGSSDVPPPQADANHSQDNAVVYREGNLVSGRLEALIQHMVPTLDYYPDRAFLFAFLLTSRLFVKPHDLLGQILALTESQLKAKQATPKERALLLPRLVQLIGEWSETFPYDFRDERVMSHVREVAVSVDGAARQEVSLLLHNLLYRLKKLEQYEAFLHSIHTEATTNSIESLSQTDVSELCGSAVSLAQQLTHIELERLSYIGPEEFVQAFAKESPNLETSFKDMKQTRNLESYVSWFNRLSYFVATEVCKHLKSKKQRVRVVDFWVETARECFNIGNFNSLMAIIAGLNMSPISRLKRTWSKVQCAKFSVLEHQMDPSCNFSSYRSTLKAAVWRSAAATDDTQRIVIPFFSLLVKDLYFLNEGCSNRLPNGHINFEKFWQLAKQVTEFITWKQVHCPFPKSPKVITYLQATPVLNEDALALASFECEPPENHEKERYKTLKSDSSSS